MKTDFYHKKKSEKIDGLIFNAGFDLDSGIDANASGHRFCFNILRTGDD
jgi:hypothetical protein